MIYFFETIKKEDVYAIDFGAANNMVIWGVNGQLIPKFPRVKGGRTQAGQFERVLEWILSQNPNAIIVDESPTVGSSGVEPLRVHNLMAKFPKQLLQLAPWAVKNYLIDNGIKKLKGKLGNLQSAEIIFKIATEQPKRLRPWGYREHEIEENIHNSVRPQDKHNYMGERSEYFMKRVPLYHEIPYHLQEIYGNGKKKHPDYNRSIVIPIAMIFDEKGIELRKVFDKKAGLCEHRYPSFYTKNTINIMRKIAGYPSTGHVPKEDRDQAWPIATKAIRHFYHLCKEHQKRVSN